MTRETWSLPYLTFSASFRPLLGTSGGKDKPGAKPLAPILAEKGAKTARTKRLTVAGHYRAQFATFRIDRKPIDCVKTPNHSVVASGRGITSSDSNVRQWFPSINSI